MRLCQEFTPTADDEFTKAPVLIEEGDDLTKLKKTFLDFARKQNKDVEDIWMFSPDPPLNTITYLIIDDMSALYIRP